MAVYEVRPGVPFAFDEVDKVTIVGSGPIWADDDLDTYTSAHSIHAPFALATISGIIAAPLPAVPSSILARVNDDMGFRATVSTANTEGATRQLFFYVGTLDSFPFDASEAPPSVVADEIVTLDYAAFGSFTVNSPVAAALAAGTAHVFFSGPGVVGIDDTADGTLYEFTLRINYAAQHMRRKYPNPTGLGVGVRRHWPHPRRGVTGYN